VDYRAALSVTAAMHFAGSARVRLDRKAAIIGGFANVIDPAVTDAAAGCYPRVIQMVDLWRASTPEHADLLGAAVPRRQPA